MRSTRLRSALHNYDPPTVSKNCSLVPTPTYSKPAAPARATTDRGRRPSALSEALSNIFAGSPRREYDDCTGPACQDAGRGLGTPVLAIEAASEDSRYVPCAALRGEPCNGESGSWQMHCQLERAAVIGVDDSFHRSARCFPWDDLRRKTEGANVRHENPKVDGSTERQREASTDALQLFLKAIGKVDLLTAAQEVQ